ncbi:roadblock/LC7 domain-containing protein [Streptomyces sp. 7-21]|jgi:predicted regulator of Ras-like GTPase activity (Roadblock/LC7/MglB family)|uniref:roadblock/LC7 domain-containing protein n=1 Tax=Streptomyces sp. 7-21 TaxID=2802283 RepID=UPI00191DF38A|nr:roadblock/LC7 domain-containing protein [Streptomyces sp. 7-21]MBL1066436.1 roadblock/LC7 domain-containing protein [Streptomyces sp. 7-21]
MMSDVPAGRPADLDWLLASFVQKVVHARSAVVASSDGVKKHVYGLDNDQADRLSAIATGLCSLGRGVGEFVDHGSGKVRQVVVEHEDALLFVSKAGPGAVLAVLTTHEADLSLVGYEMAQLVKSVASYLATPERVNMAPTNAVV